ncbi:MAG: hypothetical protein MZV64_18020 [Ignavibacteriales bacterium]|nr:hypothetical protein [Ignavibacteriales bacterium]
MSVNVTGAFGLTFDLNGTANTIPARPDHYLLKPGPIRGSLTPMLPKRNCLSSWPISSKRLLPARSMPAIPVP